MPANLIIVGEGVFQSKHEKTTPVLPEAGDTTFDSSTFDAMIDALDVKMTALQKTGELHPRKYGRLFKQKEKITKRREDAKKKFEKWKATDWDTMGPISGSVQRFGLEKLRRSIEHDISSLENN